MVGGRRDWAGLAGIEVVSGMTEDPDGTYRGFITVRALAEDGSHMAGQLDPADVRKMAMNFLGAAEAADQDAIVMGMLVRDVELSPGVAARFIHAMRAERHRLDPDPDDIP